MKVRWLRTALRNLDEEASYIASDSPIAAKLVVDRIQKAILLLPKHPSLGRPGRVYGTRELIVPNTRYIIPYRIKNGNIEILRIFHSSRKPPKQ